MLHSLTGVIVEYDENRIVVRLAGGSGIACEATVSARAVQRWVDAGGAGGGGASGGGEVTVYTYLIIKDDVPHLYGFYDSDERALFLQLIKVSGIGPRGAVGILSQIDSAVLRQAIIDGDFERIAALQRVGLKSAQKIVITLRGSVAALADELPQDELTAALLAMGYDKKSIAPVLERIRSSSDRADYKDDAQYEEHVMQQAIASLSQ